MVRGGSRLGCWGGGGQEHADKIRENEFYGVVSYFTYNTAAILTTYTYVSFVPSPRLVHDTTEWLECRLCPYWV